MYRFTRNWTLPVRAIQSKANVGIYDLNGKAIIPPAIREVGYGKTMLTINAEKFSSGVKVVRVSLQDKVKSVLVNK